MKTKAIGTLLAALAVAGGAHASPWSVDFDNGSTTGSFASSATTGIISPVLGVGDKALWLRGADTLSLTFNSSNVNGLTAPFFLVSFWLSNGGPASTAQVTLSGPGGFSKTESFAIPAFSGGNPNPDGVANSYHFGLGGQYLTAGTFTLTFDNLPQSANFFVDDINVSAVPEPSTYALMLAGLGVIGFAARRRTKHGGTHAGAVAA